MQLFAVAVVMQSRMCGGFAQKYEAVGRNTIRAQGCVIMDLQINEERIQINLLDTLFFLEVV